MDNAQIIEKLKKSNLTKYENLDLLFNVCLNITDTDRELAIKTGKFVKNKAAQQASNVKFFELYNRCLLMLAQNKELDSYMLYIEKDREPKERFYLPRRKQFAKFGLVQAMQDMINDKLDILSISMPPGTAKTTLGEFFMSAVMGYAPQDYNLMESHSGFVTRMYYDAVKNIISSSEYRWKDIFPDVKIDEFDAKEQTINLDKYKPFKSLTCRAIGASNTGVTRCNGYLYCDDLCSGIEMALSKERMDKLWMAYNTDIKTRRKQGCKEIHIANRFSVNDVIGNLQKLYEGNDRTRFIAIPDVDPVTDESNFEYDYGVGFDREYFRDIENSLDDVTYRCMFKNEPIEREGLLYHTDELKRYFELPPGEPDAVLAICDTKDTGTDYEFLPVVYQYGQNYYLEDCICDNAKTEILDVRCADILVKHKVKMARFESNNAGGRTADKVNELQKEKGGITHIQKRFTTTNKETKIIVNSPWVKEHVLFKDATMYAPKSDYGKMMGFLVSYSQVGKNKTDDVPDGLAQLALFVQSLSSGQVEVFKRPC